MSAKKKYILPIFIPFQGCKHRCIYCDQSAITGVDDISVKKSALDQFNLWLARRAEWDEVAFYGGTFTALPRSLRTYLYDMVSPFSVRLSTCPDTITEDFLNEINIYPIRTVELGVQSLSEEVLRGNNRFYSTNDVVSAFSRLHGKTDTAMQLMVGMYGEGREEFLHTCKMLSGVNAGYARIYPTLVFKNTVLGEKYLAGEFIPLTGAECLMRAAWLYIKLESLGIKVIRVGLPQESVSNYVIGGYKHDAFGELVRTVMMYSFACVYGCLPDIKGFYGYKGLIKPKFGLPLAIDVDTMQKIALKLMEHYKDGETWLNSDEIYRFAETIVRL